MRLVPPPRNIPPGKRRRTYLAVLIPLVVLIVAVGVIAGLLRDIAPILVDHFRFWRREVRALVAANRALWKG